MPEHTASSNVEHNKKPEPVYFDQPLLAAGTIQTHSEPQIYLVPVELDDLVCPGRRRRRYGRRWRGPNGFSTGVFYRHLEGLLGE